MNLLFHANQISMRGTDFCTYYQAKYCRDVWKFNVKFAYDKTSQWNRPIAHEWWTKEFGEENIFGYDRFEQVDDYIVGNKIENIICTKGGEKDNKLPTKCKVCTYAVFQNYEPHGDVYAYISKWLSDVMTEGKSPYVEYPVWMPEPNKNLREELGVPQDAFCFFRMGGESEFDLQWVHQIIWNIVNTNPHFYFVFMNTNKFCPDHKQIIHLPASTDTQYQANLINSCDAGLNARSLGESFGLFNALCLYMDKPIFCWSDGKDKNHVRMIDDSMYLYDNPQDFVNKLNRFVSGAFVEQKGYFKSKVAANSLENIMETQFKPVFLGEKA